MYMLLHGVSRISDLQATDDDYFFLARLGGLLPCLHLLTTSLLLFNAFLSERISTFSSRHKLHCPDCLILQLDFFTTSQWIAYSMLLFFNSQIYFDNSVSLWYLWCLNDLTWLLNLSLKVPPVRPTYDFVSPPATTVALYTISVDRHSPLRRHSSFLLQLHFLMSSLALLAFLMTFVLCDCIMARIFFMQL